MVGLEMEEASQSCFFPFERSERNCVSRNELLMFCTGLSVFIEVEF